MWTLGVGVCVGVEVGIEVGIGAHESVSKGPSKIAADIVTVHQKISYSSPCNSSGSVERERKLLNDKLLRARVATFTTIS